MVVVDDSLLAFTERRAAELASVSVEKARRWAADGVVVPSTDRAISPSRRVRLYDLEETVWLCAVSELRENGVSLQQIKKVLDQIRERGFHDPWRGIEYAYDPKAGELFWRQPDGVWEGGRQPGQSVARAVLHLDHIRRTVRTAPLRRPDQFGKIESHRGVQRNRQVFAGTRVRVEAVHQWMHRGADDARILEAYPLLEDADLDVARDLLATTG